MRVAPPTKMDHESYDIVYWYLDTLGRPAAVLEKKNVVDGEHSQIVYVRIGNACGLSVGALHLPEYHCLNQLIM